MSVRARLFLLVASTVAVTVMLVTWSVSLAARRSFEAFDRQRTGAVIAQFRREFSQQGEDVSRRVDRIISSDTFQRVSYDISRHEGDYGAFINDAAPMASAQSLDVVDLVAADGRLISSAAWPARFGYPHPWAAQVAETTGAVPTLQRIELPDGTALAIVVVRRVGSGGRALLVAGGRLVDERFLRTFTLPGGTRALLYRNLDSGINRDRLIDAAGVSPSFPALEPLIARVRDSGRETIQTIRWPDGPETIDAMALTGSDGGVLGVLMVGASGREGAALLSRIRWSGVGLGAAGILFGLVLSYLLARRVTRPVEALAAAAQEIAAGRWDVRTDDIRASGEVAALATAFDAMARELADQRERLIQAERVAAWRELARRLAHELKNPLFPLRLTLDNLRKAKGLASVEFDEVFEESLATMTDGLTNLNTIVGRFSDFAKMPAPEFGSVSPNAEIERVIRLFRPRMEAAASPVRITLDLDPASPSIRADGEQLGRAVQNLVLNALDAMPQGGELTIRTRMQNQIFQIDVTDTGGGLTDEERRRLFTPYYTTKQHGTGLGLAIVQSVVADHGGKVWVDGAAGRGTTFHLLLPSEPRPPVSERS